MFCVPKMSVEHASFHIMFGPLTMHAGRQTKYQCDQEPKKTPNAYADDVTIIL